MIMGISFEEAKQLLKSSTVFSLYQARGYENKCSKGYYVKTDIAKEENTPLNQKFPLWVIPSTNKKLSHSDVASVQFQDLYRVVPKFFWEK